MRICLFLLLSFVSVCSPLWAHHEDPSSPIRVGVFQFEPINFIDQTGGVQGLYPDLLRAIVEEEDWSLEFVPGTWAQGLERLESGEIDLVTTIAQTPERAKVMDFNHEAVVSIWGQVFLRPGTRVETILDMEGLRVAITDRDISGQNFIKTIAGLGVHCEVVSYPHHSDVFAALQKKEVDAGVAPNHFGLRHASEYGLVPSSIQFSPFSIYFASKRGHFASFLEHIDQHLAAWKIDKTSYYYQRLNYWMGGQKLEREIVPVWMLVCLGGALLAAVILLLSNMFFKVQVRKATAALRSREREYRQLVQGVNNIILRVDKSGVVHFINRYGLKYFGFKKEEIIGRNVFETIVPQQEVNGRDLTSLVAGVLIDPEGFEDVENENICKDGRRVYIQWRNQPDYDEKGNVVGLFSVGTDITERRRAEVVLRSKEEKFRTLFEHVTDYALVLQPQGSELVIIDLNESACRQHGYQRDELLGQPLSLLDTQKVPAADPRVRRLALGESLRFEVDHRRKDGSVFPVEVDVRPIEIDGELYLFSIERDLTRQKKAESDKSELENSLRQKFKMEAIGTLAGGIAHDFNNILAIIQGTTEMLRRKLPQGDSNLHRVETILNASSRAKNLVNQVLSFSRQQEQTLEPLLLASLIEETAGLLRATVPRTVELKKTIDENCAHVRINGDTTQLQQVLINLCNNAVFAMHEKGVVEIGLKKVQLAESSHRIDTGLDAGEYLHLSVIDSGDGIDDECLQHIFDPFYTTKDVGQGTGMGLAVVHGIVQAHKGQVHVESTVGVGTRFDIFLPVTGDEPSPQEKHDGLLLTGDERILFIDDEEELSVWGEELLTQQGFRPVCSSSSVAALELFKASPQAFDLIISDQSMPELSGLELIAKIRQLRPGLPAILCTGYSTRVSAKVIEQQGISGFLLKPYSETELLDIIRSSLDG